MNSLALRAEKRQYGNRDNYRNLMPKKGRAGRGQGWEGKMSFSSPLNPSHLLAIASLTLEDTFLLTKEWIILSWKSGKNTPSHVSLGAKHTLLSFGEQSSQAGVKSRLLCMAVHTKITKLSKGINFINNRSPLIKLRSHWDFMQTGSLAMKANNKSYMNKYKQTQIHRAPWKVKYLSTPFILKCTYQQQDMNPWV